MRLFRRSILASCAGLVLAAAAGAAPAAAPPVPDPAHGGFESGPAREPAGWLLQGTHAPERGWRLTTTDQAYSGKRALLIEVPLPKEGMAAPPGSSMRAQLYGDLTAPKGTVTFRYKVLSGSPNSFHVYGVGISPDHIEVAALRPVFQGASEAAGSGRWHEGKLTYDRTHHSMANRVRLFFGVSNRGGAVLVDDVSWTAQEIQ